MLEISLFDQGITALLALGLGACLAFLYELFALLRRAARHGAVTVVLDLIFCLAAFFSFAAFTMARTFGALRLDAGLLCALGFFLYRATLARLLTPLLGKAFRFLFKLLCLPLFPLRIFMKKRKKSFSEVFQKRKNWCIIKPKVKSQHSVRQEKDGEARVAAKKKKRIPLIVKLVVAVVAVYCVITFVDLQQRIQAGQAVGTELEQTLQEQRQKNAALEQEAGTDLDNAAIAQMAREKLGLIFPGETVYFDVSN